MSVDLSPYQRFDLAQRPAVQVDRPARLRPGQVVGAFVAVISTSLGAAGAAGASVLVKVIPCYLSTPCTSPSPTVVTSLRLTSVGLLLLTAPVAGQRLHRWWAWLTPLFVGGVGLAIFSVLRLYGRV